MKFLNLVLFALLILICKSSFAQKTELVNSGDIINKSIELADSGQYKAARTLLNKVSKSDTNYVAVLVRKALICKADSQYNEGIKICQEALSLKTDHEFEKDIYNLYGGILLDQGNYDEALKILDKGMQKFPQHDLLYFNKGIAYLRKEQYELAESWLQKTLMINPYMYSAHYHLGLTALLQGKIVPAFISYSAYLLFSPKGKFSGDAISMLQKISANTEDINELRAKRKLFPNANYQGVEDVLVAKIALSTSYKIFTELDDPISRQIQAMIEKLEYTDADTDFWIQYYVPFLKKTYAEKKFDVLINHMFSNVNIPSIIAYGKKNEKQINAFTSEASVYFDVIQSTRELMFKNRDTVKRRYHYENGILLGKGVIDKTGKSLVGDWEGYYQGGNIRNKGIYTGSGRNGAWAWFFENGTLKAKENYVDGKLSGKQEYYYFNGNKSSSEDYLNGELNGALVVYYYGGGVKTELNYLSGKVNGEEKQYYTSGQLAAIKNYSAGKLNGPEKSYHRNGKLKSVGQYVNEKPEGNYKEYSEKGTVLIDGNFVKGLSEGEWKYYDEAGKVTRKMQLKGGEENGLHEEFYANGQLSTSYNVVKDKIHGELLEYYRNGKVLSKRAYENGIMVKATYLDQLGGTLSNLVKSGNGNKLISYNSQGFKLASLTYDQAGLITGLDTIYYNTGNIHQICNYKDDMLDGKLTIYYENGKIKSEVNMSNGKSNGYAMNYYRNGNIESEGWIVEDMNQGTWHFYHENGKLNAIHHYLDNEPDGYKEEYAANGQISVGYKYYRGWLEEVTNYDAQGKAIANDVFHKGQGKFRLLYPDGKLMAETTVKNGEYDGIFKSYYFDGSLERVFNYKAGLLDSSYVYYQHGGSKLMEGLYRHGNKAGFWKFYNEDGKLSRTSNYDGDLLNGEYTTYYPNGSKEYVTFIKDDKTQGIGKTFDVRGALAYQILCEDDLVVGYTYNDSSGKLKDNIVIDAKNGEMKAFYANGKPSRICQYLGREKHGNDRIYYENGNLRSEENLVYNTLEGPSKTYYENGKVKEDFNYLNDNLHGLIKTYYENGSIKRETPYEHGIIQGTVKIYNESGKLLQAKNYDHGTLKSVTNE